MLWQRKPSSEWRLNSSYWLKGSLIRLQSRWWKLWGFWKKLNQDGPKHTIQTSTILSLAESSYKWINLGHFYRIPRQISTLTLREKCSNTEFFLVRIFPHSDWIRRDTSYLSVFSPNAVKYRPEKTPYSDTFHAVSFP